MNTSEYARRALLLFTLASTTAACTTSRMESSDNTVPVWGVWEERFVAAAPLADADDLQLRVNLTAPSGEMRSVDGFWDGGEVWKVRFMPDEGGTWRYRTEASPLADGLHGQEGTFTAAADRSAAQRFRRHGSIRVASNGRHLEHADGTPFFWLGDTAWNGALKSTDQAWETYLSDRAGKGFTGIQFVTTQWRAADANAEGELAYSGFEDIEIHPRFFDRIDARIDAVNDAGLFAAPVLLWTLGEPERNPGKLPEDQAIKLARYLTARYGAHHVILAADRAPLSQVA